MKTTLCFFLTLAALLVAQRLGLSQITDSNYDQIKYNQMKDDQQYDTVKYNQMKDDQQYEENHQNQRRDDALYQQQQQRNRAYDQRINRRYDNAQRDNARDRH